LVLVPVNIFCCFWSLQNILFLQGPFQKSKDFAGTIFLINGFSHHVPRVKIITKMGAGTKTKTRHICRDQKQQKKITGTKTKTRHIYRDQNHILTFNFLSSLIYVFHDTLLLNCLHLHFNIRYLKFP